MKDGLQVGYFSGDQVFLVYRLAHFTLISLCESCIEFIALLHASVFVFESTIFLLKLVHEFLSNKETQNYEKRENLAVLLECLKSA